MKKASALFFLAVTFMLIVVADLILWFVITGKTNSFEQARQEYIAYFPDALQSPRLTTVISIVLLIIAGLLFLYTAKTRTFKVAASILGIICALLLFWNVFSLM
jgi:Na+/H+ antiporter NhaC